MSRVTVNLGKEQQDVLEALVEAGRFSSIDEAVEAGVEALRQQELIFDDALRDEVRARLSRNEPRIPADRVFTEMHGHIDNIANKAR